MAPLFPPAAAAPSRSLAVITSALIGWSVRGGLAILDQALYAGAHLVLNILLARWLQPTEYGAFAVAYSVFLLVSSIHGALLLEPMMVYGSGKYSNSTQAYVGVLARWHLILTLVAGLLLLTLSPVFAYIYSPLVKRTIVALSLSLPLALLTWFTRRVFYITLRPAGAALGGAIYCAIVLVGASFLFQSGGLSPISAVLTMAVASGVAGSLQLFHLRPRASGLESEPAARVRREHWGYGRWALVSALALWLPLNIYYIVMPFWFGLEGVGTLKALMNLANPVLHTLTAIGMILTPVFVRERALGGPDGLRRSVVRLTGAFFLGCGAYLVFLLIFRADILELLYGGRYFGYPLMPIVLLGLLPFGATLSVTLGSTLRALERPRELFWCYLASSIVALAAGLPLTRLAGVPGALLGLLLFYSVAGLAMSWFLWRPSGGAGSSTPTGPAMIE